MIRDRIISQKKILPTKQLEVKFSLKTVWGPEGWLTNNFMYLWMMSKWGSNYWLVYSSYKGKYYITYIFCKINSPVYFTLRLLVCLSLMEFFFQFLNHIVIVSYCKRRIHALMTNDNIVCVFRREREKRERDSFMNREANPGYENCR